MRKSSVWGWLAMAGFAGVGVAAGCGGTSAVGDLNGAVSAGKPCSPAGATSPAADGCNTCTCGSDGKYACTDKACGGGTGADGSTGTAGSTGGGGGCKEGEKKLADDNCNMCTCGADGLFACTLLACVECIPGMTKVAPDGCNNCTCSGSGSWACTDTACGACKPGEMKMVECNTCACSDTGQWGCTKKACLPTQCKAGESKIAPDGCNNCTCTAGGLWACTEKACVPAMCPAPVPSGGACDTVIVWAKDPVGGQCCMYGTPCTSPKGWTTFFSEKECVSASMCPVPVAIGGRVCPAVVVYAKDPATGLCCQYGDACHSPPGWTTYNTDAECQKAAK